MKNPSAEVGKEKAARGRAAQMGEWLASALLGRGFGFGLGRDLEALDVSLTTTTFLHFVGLSAHNFFTLPNCFCWLAAL